MKRTMTLFGAGAVAGAAVVYAALGGSHDSALTPPATPGIALPRPSAAVPDDVDLPATAGGFAARRLETYEAAARISDPADLETQLERAVAQAPSRARDVEIDALLGRLAELDIARAAAFGQRLALDITRLAPVWQQWANRDAAAALAALGRVTPSVKQRTLAVELLDVFGNDARGVERVAAALPSGDRLGFTIDALVERAEREPDAALAAVLEIDNSTLKTLAAQRIAEIAARGDPAAAATRALSITDSQARTAFLVTSLEAWSAIDPDGALAFIATASLGDIPVASVAVLQTVAASDPERVLSMVDRLPPAMRTNAQRAALQALAAADPRAAAARANAMPAGAARDTAMQAIAEGYGQRYPDEAWAWAQGQTNVSAMSGVMRGIAAVDPDRAIDLMIRELERSVPAVGTTGTRLAPTALLSPLLASNPGHVSRFADRLLAVQNTQLAGSTLTTVLANWGATDSRAALDWGLRNVSRLDPGTLSQLASQIGRTDPDLAIRTVDALPPNHRATWIANTATAVAQSDVQRALEFMTRFRGQPGYDDGVVAVARAAAQSDPAAAARLLAETNASTQQMRNVVPTLASSWAQRDPVAAASWAQSLGDAALQRTAFGNVATAWARNDPAAAQRWALGLPSGVNRDSALSSYISTTAANGVIDARILEAFSTDTARQQAALTGAQRLVRTDPARARQLVDTYITDPALRRTAENLLATGTGGLVLPGAAAEVEALLRTR